MDQGYYVILGTGTLWLATMVGLNCFEGWVVNVGTPWLGSGTYNLIRAFDGSLADSVVVA